MGHNIKNIFLVPAHNYTNKSNFGGESSLLIFHSGSVGTILLSDDSQILKIQVKWLILWWSSTVSSKKLMSEIAFVIIILVPMSLVSKIVSIVIGLCYCLRLSNSGAAWRLSCCSTSMIKSNTKVNFVVYSQPDENNNHTPRDCTNTLVHFMHFSSFHLSLKSIWYELNFLSTMM